MNGVARLKEENVTDIPIFDLPPDVPQRNSDDFNSILRLNGVDIDIHACVSPGASSQLVQGFLGYPRGYIAGILQASMMQGLLGETNKKFADLRHQQLSMILYEAFEHYAALQKILAWFVANQLSGEIASLAGRAAGAWFTNYALKLRKLPNGARRALLVPNLILAMYGSAIMKIDSGDRELARIIGAMITGRGNFEVCIPIDAMKQQLEKMIIPSSPELEKLLSLLRRTKDFMDNLGTT